MALPVIAVPSYQFTLPSTQKKITIRPMLVKEEKILLMAKQSGQKADMTKAILEVLRACISGDPGPMAIFDMEYLFLKLRSISISNIAKVSYKDTEDEEVYNFDIDLDKIEIDTKKLPSNQIKLTNDIMLELNWPSAAFYANPKIYDLSEDEIFVEMINDCMYKIYEKEKVHDPKDSTPEERTTFIENMPAKAAGKIKEFLSAIPTLQHEIKYKNKKGSDRTIMLNTLEDFFM